ncbi:MAG: excalibur calcium-binding domain-containing protein [Rhodobacteraceae bacterium]|nr:excalibur calcium-binding domain-containing protein [Paracoccaceae bacterium]MYF45357.1 excalibur calcium-binding domain-containing protein [Paracoccaceae bacterium]MYI90917.1 excalibur calcium-binding domain-containing protein [Paracoccaceae bacterium]MYJ86166.1 excalibur calcium-binding domain-containing protein [Paracoccaceae bacterium]
MIRCRYMKCNLMTFAAKRVYLNLLAKFFLLLVVLGLDSGLLFAEEMWRGLRVAPENRCAPYDRNDYRYPQSVELEIIRSMGGRIYSPYTGRYFKFRSQTDIEHMVATVEAHDSGLCARNNKVKRQFASDLDNLTLASPEVNRQQKSYLDAAEWLPHYNKCWFVHRNIQIRLEYQLTIDRKEANAIDKVIENCDSFQMVFYEGTPYSPKPTSEWDENGDGRVTCKEARKAGIAPVYVTHPAYKFMRDGDGDGVVCE